MEDFVLTLVFALFFGVEQMQGDRGVLVGRELTKMHEETFRGTVEQAVAHLGGPGGETRGEFTLVLQETAKMGRGGDDAGDKAAIEMMQVLIDEGVKTSIAGKAVASALGLPKNKAKKLALGLSSKDKSRVGGNEEEDEEQEQKEGSESSVGFKVVGLDHIVLRARDPMALESFYTKVLGCKLVKRNEKAKMSHLSMGASLLDIIGYADGDVEASSTSSTANMDHFCVSVSPFDPDSITKHLEANGLEPTPPKMRCEDPGFFRAWVVLRREIEFDAPHQIAVDIPGPALCTPAERGSDASTMR